jgi:hypothetical protein
MEFMNLRDLANMMGVNNATRSLIIQEVQPITITVMIPQKWWHAVRYQSISYYVPQETLIITIIGLIEEDHLPSSHGEYCYCDYDRRPLHFSHTTMHVPVRRLQLHILMLQRLNPDGSRMNQRMVAAYERKRRLFQIIRMRTRLHEPARQRRIALARQRRIAAAATVRAASACTDIDATRPHVYAGHDVGVGHGVDAGVGHGAGMHAHMDAGAGGDGSGGTGDYDHAHAHDHDQDGAGTYVSIDEGGTEYIWLD